MEHTHTCTHTHKTLARTLEGTLEGTILVLKGIILEQKIVDIAMGPWGFGLLSDCCTLPYSNRGNSLHTTSAQLVF